MILIGIGANLPSPGHGPPRETCAAALAELGRRDVRVLAGDVTVAKESA